MNETTPRCPDCDQPLEVLKACGAVDYFCATHGLISKKRVNFVPSGSQQNNHKK
ncbi:hypothetical protein CIG19_14855 [Enterobacterales bacterium CwR94]|nr:hypothetical protein CIG19_14855 [Enterobacterales bacterium CwR94]